MLEAPGGCRFRVSSVRGARIPERATAARSARALAVEHASIHAAANAAAAQPAQAASGRAAGVPASVDE